MACPRCNASNQEGASFCQNCGEGLNSYSPVNSQEKNGGRALSFALIVMGWGCLVSIIWLLFQKVAIPVFKLPYESLTKFYTVAGGIFTFVTVTLLIVFAIIVNNNTARIFFIIFALIHAVVFFAYRIPSVR